MFLYQFLFCILPLLERFMILNLKDGDCWMIMMCSLFNRLWADLLRRLHNAPYSSAALHWPCPGVRQLFQDQGLTI